MRARVSATTLKRLEALEQQRGQRKVVALFPELMPVDHWGALAVKMQAILKANVRSGEPPDYSSVPHLPTTPSA